ncbi:MAG: DUF3179 domain-containing protein [Acidimicrobiia bacterium]
MSQLGRRRSVVGFAMVVAALVVAACSSAPRGTGSSAGGGPDPIFVDQVTTSPKESGPSALAAALGRRVDGLPVPVVEPDAFTAGGPPPDGIPPIDVPTFERAGDIAYLADNEPVLTIEIGGEARAYPVQVMIWHEIVNDTISGVPVAVTYCPLCNSALAYDRRVGTRVLSFGTSGLLWKSALVMYDRQTESLWSHFTGEAVAGVLTHTELETFPVATSAWGAWRAAHPDALVLSRQTGFDRDYGANPYPGYDDLTSRPFLFEGQVDGRFTAMTRVVGIERDGEAVAVALVELRSRRVVAVDLASTALTVWWQPGTASALDRAQIANGDDVGSTGVFAATLDGRTLSFSSRGDDFVDAQTATTWNRFGVAVSGPLTGARLEPVTHVDTFWFAWGAFRPDTAVAPN